MSDLAVFPTAVAASCVLTCDTIPTAADTVTIGTFVYTFRASVTTTAREVKLGISLATALANLASAINLDGTAGVYGSATVKHTSVRAVATATTLTITALMPGSVGNLIVTTETLTPAGDVWATALATGGAGSGQADLLAFAQDIATYEQMNAHVVSRIAALIAAIPA